MLTGFSVGVSAQASFCWSTGTSTRNSASVGHIADQTEFAINGYSSGIFTYVFENDASGQPFEVIDFWVDQVLRSTCASASSGSASARLRVSGTAASPSSPIRRGVPVAVGEHVRR